MQYDQSSIMLLFEHDYRHNAVVLSMTLERIMLKFSSIAWMYVTLTLARLNDLGGTVPRRTAGMVFFLGIFIYLPHNYIT